MKAGNIKIGIDRKLIDRLKGLGLSDEDISKALQKFYEDNPLDIRADTLLHRATTERYFPEMFFKPRLPSIEQISEMTKISEAIAKVAEVVMGLEDGMMKTAAMLYLARVQSCAHASITATLTTEEKEQVTTDMLHRGLEKFASARERRQRGEKCENPDCSECNQESEKIVN